MADGGARTEVRMYARADIDPWTKNPRTGPLHVEDIVGTLMAEGKRIPGRTITEPLRLRREPSGRLTALRGNRRLMAAAIAEIDELPGIEVTWTDDEALEQALLEEARKALTPLEEAAALAGLRDRGLDVEAIARKAGRTARHVHKRLALFDAMIDEGKAMLASGQITIPLAEALAGLSPEAQRGAIEDARRKRHEGDEPVSAREIEYSIRRARLRLADGGFPLDDAELVAAAGACLACPKRSGAQVALFLDGLVDNDLCSDPACFKAKQEAQLVRLKTKAQAAGVRVVDKPAEVKSLFPYGDQLKYDAPFIDLDDACNLVRPPAAKADEAVRRGGPERCADEDAINGEHEYGVFVTAEEQPGHPAAVAGCKEWAECAFEGCEAWEEAEDEDAVPGAPRGWKPPTWREVLEGAIAKVHGPPGDTAPKPDLVAEDRGGRAHELVDKKKALQLLEAAGVVDAQRARSEIREAKPAKKPGQLEPWQIDQKAREAADDEVLGAIVTKAEKKAPDVKLWRLLAGLCLANWHNGAEVARARARRETEAKGKLKADDVTALREWVAEEKDDGALRALAVELLAGRSYGEDSPRAIAARFFNVDVAGITAAAKTRIKDEIKEKQKAKAAKAKKAAAKGKPAAESPKPAPKAPPDLRASILAACASERTKTQLAVICKAWPKSAVLAEVDKLHGEKLLSEQGGKYLVQKTPPKGDPRPLLIEGQLESVLRSKPGTVAELAERTQSAEKHISGLLTLMSRYGKAHLDELDERWYPGPKPEAALSPSEQAPAKKLSKAELREIEESAIAYLNGRSMTEEKLLGAIALSDEYDFTRPVLRELVTAGKLVCMVEGEVRTYSLPAVVEAAPPPAEACPIAWEDVERLAASIGIDDPHEGAQSPANVWSVVKLLRARTELELVRHELHRELSSWGIDTIDIAWARLVEDEHWTMRKGKGQQNDVLCRPPNVDAPTGPHPRPSESDTGHGAPDAKPETVQLEGPAGSWQAQARKSAEALPCPRCKAKVGKPCLGPKGKLGTGWFHADRVPVSVPPAQASTSCKGCGCNDKTACIPADGGECKLEGDVCSVCTETGAQVLRVCAKPIGDAALAKKLGDVEPHRLAGVVELLLERGKLKRDDKKKLVAV